MKTLKQHAEFNIANMGDTNNDFSIRIKTSNDRVICFVIAIIMITNNILIIIIQELH